MPNPKTATRDDLDTPNDTMLYEVSRDILPIHCPMPGSSLCQFTESQHRKRG